jgi:hypothetical protein
MSDDTTTRRCSKCKEVFAATEEFFYRNRATKDGRYHRCKKCCAKVTLHQELLPGFKKCTGCQRILAYDQFYSDPRTKRDGLYPCCKKCFAQRGLKSRNKDVERTCLMALATYYRHHEENLQRGKRYRENNKQKNAARHHSYYLRNKAKIREYQRNNPHIWKKSSASWRKRNPERARMLSRIRSHERRAKIHVSGGSYTPDDVAKQLKAQGGNCWWCGAPLDEKYHIDHRIPISKGGSNDAGNIVIAHPQCNLHKSAKMPWDFNGRLL